MDVHENHPIEKDELTGDIIISGHEYDNIKELDNKLPKWWLWLFYITIIFALAYVINYHFMNAPLQNQEYQNEMAEAKALYKNAPGAATLDTANLVAMTDEASLNAGKEVFTKNCVACHLAQGQGLVGPNLTDEFWIHGCSIQKIVATITIGVPDKGMISWKDQLNPEQIKQVASYILTLKGTNPPNPKAPQGDPCQ
jgi:cytochrome c oxidase cbb3-type subunit III